MIHSIKIVFGKEQVNKLIVNIPLSNEEKAIYEKEYQFETKSELDAFCKGVNEAVGWNEFFVFEAVPSSRCSAAHLEA
jgi:hypothetical protein